MVGIGEVKQVGEKAQAESGRWETVRRVVRKCRVIDSKAGWGASNARHSYDAWSLSQRACGLVRSLDQLHEKLWCQTASWADHYKPLSPEGWALRR